jgi:tryptophan-rich sensory protein
MLRRNRYIDAGIEAGKVTIAQTTKAAHSLWLQITGFVFCVFSVVGASALWREYQSLQRPWTQDARFLITAVFTLMFAYFGISAFVKARR